MPEKVPLYKEMTVRGYLNFVAEAKGIRGRKRKASISDVIEEVGLSDTAHRVIGNLSRGYQQRVGLAQAMVGEPPVLILDEPTIGLDPRQIVEIRNVIKKMEGRRTVILCSHILPEVSQVCSHVVIINAGKIVAHGTQDDLEMDLDSDITSVAHVTGDPGRIEPVLKGIEGVKSVSLRKQAQGHIFEFRIAYSRSLDIRSKVTRAIYDAGGDILEFRSHGISLEDIFIRIVTAEEKGVPDNVM
jgi:ABC-2 type transport system ATP-binding protein